LSGDAGSRYDPVENPPVFSVGEAERFGGQENEDDPSSPSLSEPRVRVRFDHRAGEMNGLGDHEPVDRDGMT
jgi:hypothetical protein